MDLPFLTSDIEPVPGRIRAIPEDFRVEEVPAYTPSGEGEHVFVEFEKRDLSTAEALRRLGRALGVSPRDASVAGLKDRHAITTQWASFFGTTPEAAREARVDGLRVLRAERHGNKLRTGHLRANRFELRIRDAAAHVEAVQSVLARVERDGVPNYFGEQRFGRGGKSLDMARAWLLDGGPAPRDKRDRKFMVSVLQARVFNRVLAERVTLNELGAYVEGDLLRKEDTGGLFTTTDTADAAERVRTWAVSATGPMVGAKMRWPEGLAREREVRALEAEGLAVADLERFRRDGEGTRRVVRVRPKDTRVAVDGADISLAFELPSGAYATVVLREILKRDGADSEDTQRRDDDVQNAND